MNVLDLLPGWAKLALIAAAVSALAGFYAWRVHVERDYGRAEVQALWDAQTGAREKAAREASEENRRIETKRASLAKEIANATAREKSAIRAALDTALRDADSLRNAIELYASGGGTAPGNPATEPRIDDRAPVLGQLLATCAREAIEDAGIAEALATQVRGLQSAYRSLTP